MIVTRVLLVEDNRDMLTMITETLTLDGYEVIEATNGEEGWNLLQEGKPVDIVIADVKMPVMDGWELLEKIRASSRWSPLPCIIFSGESTDREIALAKGANAFLLKPFRHLDLVQIIQELLG
jgi:CheY-like chemotaxis protein